MIQNRRLTVTVAVLAAALLTAVPSAVAERSVDRTVAASSSASVEVENIAGSITVVGWDRSEVRVTGTVHDQIEEVEIEGSGNRIEISVEYPKKSNRASADLEIRVPRKATVEVETVSAEIEARDLAGDLELASVSGDVTVAGSPRTIEAASVSGDVVIDARSRSTSVGSVSGDVAVRGVSGELEAETVSGRAHVAGGPYESVEMSTVSGSLRFEGELARGASLDAESVSGNVTLALPAGIAASFDLESFSGAIDCAWGPRPQRTSRYAPGTELSFSDGDDARIEASTLSGRLEIVRR